MPPPAERRAANHISPQQTRLGDLRLGVSETTVLTQGQEESSHHPFPSLIQDAMRRKSTIRQEALTLLHIVQSNPLAGNGHAHQCGMRACHPICAEMETLEDALGQIP